MNVANHSLAIGSHVDHYSIDKVIGGGGFSVVYLATARADGQRVIIKEYMPRKLARRSDDGAHVIARDEASSDQFNAGRRLFFQEAATLADLKHPHVVDVSSFFRANGTVYMVMAWSEGITLQDLLKQQRGGLAAGRIMAIFLPLLDGLDFVHQRGLLHLDIKPGNIYLRAGDDPLLIDFGAAHLMQQSRKFQAGQVVTVGYAPIEQSTPGGYVGPWTDIYAIGATMRTCLNGVAPPDARQRYMEDTLRPSSAQFRKLYPQPLLAAIDWALEVDPRLRPQSVAELVTALKQPPAENEPQIGLMQRLSRLWQREKGAK
jgi:serine/threonine protein kinase